MKYIIKRALPIILLPMFAFAVKGYPTSAMISSLSVGTNKSYKNARVMCNDQVWTEPSGWASGMFGNSFWAPGHIVQLQYGEYMELEFADGVCDDPRHPYGVDLICYAADNMVISPSGSVSATTDPKTRSVVLNKRFLSRALVEVSADGEYWYPIRQKLNDSDTLPLCAYWALSEPNASGSYWAGVRDIRIPTNPDVLKTYVHANVTATNNEHFVASVDGSNYRGGVFSEGNLVTFLELSEAYGDGAGGMGIDLSELPSWWTTNSMGFKTISKVRIRPYFDMEDLASAITVENGELVIDPDEMYDKITDRNTMAINIYRIVESKPINEFSFKDAKYDGPKFYFWIDDNEVSVSQIECRRWVNLTNRIYSYLEIFDCGIDESGYRKCYVESGTGNSAFFELTLKQ